MTPCQKLLKQEGTARRIESMQQSSATPSLHLWFLGIAEDCCMLSILLAVPSCFNSFWHGVIPTSYVIFSDFYTCIRYKCIYMYIHISHDIYSMRQKNFPYRRHERPFILCVVTKKMVRQYSTPLRPRENGWPAKQCACTMIDVTAISSMLAPLYERFTVE